jgi:hypothetical protein
LPELGSSVYRALNAIVRGRKWGGKGGHPYIEVGRHGETTAMSRDAGFLLGSMACGEDDIPMILLSR